MKSNDQQHKWASFTYIGKEAKIIAKLFRSYNVKVAFKEPNTLEKQVRPKRRFTDQHNKSGKNK
jgi:hypothetical protein